MQGTAIKDFKLVERLGKGGWGEVWSAEQQIVKTKVAIKLLDVDVSRHDGHVERFFNEAIAAGKIPHAGIVKIYDVGFHDDRAFLIMELLAGETLASRIRRTTRLSLDGMLEIARQIVGVLAATHDAGITHRDLKPDNVFLIPDAELGERVKVLDFGIAKLGASASLTATGSGSMGTPAYMAPEQWNDAASADRRSDIYSLGCVMFEMCCGRPPFLAASTGEACTKHLHEPPPRARDFAPALPATLDALIDQMLAKDPDDRPRLADIARTLEIARPSAGDIMLAATAVPAAAAPTVTSLAGAVMPRPRVDRPRRRWPIAVGGIAIAGTIGAVAITRGGGEVEPPRAALEAIDDYRNPTGATLINRRSETLWEGVRDDFARACARSGDPRWCAGRAFAAGELALIQDRVQLAIVEHYVSVLTDPSWSTGYVGLAGALSHARDRDRALAAARQAQTIEPGWSEPAAAAARAYISVREVDDALIEYRRAMTLSRPDNAVLLAEVALAYHYAYKDTEAETLAAKADRLDPSLVSVRVLYAERALETGKAATALEEADKALAMSPKNGAALIARGDALALADRRQEAIDTYEHAIALKGGLNILAISEGRLAIIEQALQHGELPPPRVALRSPPTVRPNGAPSIDSRAAPTGSPGSPGTPRALTERSAPHTIRVPDRAGPHTGPNPPSQRSAPPNNRPLDVDSVDARSPPNADDLKSRRSPTDRSPPNNTSQQPADNRSPPAAPVE